ncbi:YqgE/AlgH family protein [Sphingobacterium griseoflavum]|nr:YqgE/AlgH family protein [Sphingobacterium griseoflavum]
MFNIHAPTKGSLLLAEPFMLDSNFDRSVILLCEHHPENGTMGLVLNSRSTLLLSDIFPDAAGDEFALYIGGPVQVDSLFFIHTAGEKIAGSWPLIDGIYFGGDINQALALIADNLLQPEHIKFFLGYAGWNIGQLDQEIAQNSWLVHNKFPAELLFVKDGEDLWKQALINLGPKFAHVANFPKTPDLN